MSSKLELIKKTAKEKGSLSLNNNLKYRGHPDSWGIDGQNALKYFRDPQLLDIVVSYLKETKKNGKVYHLDLAGRASFPPELVDKSYLFARSRLNFEDAPDRKYIEGDFFEKKDVRQIGNICEEDNVKFDIITCEPVGGLEEYKPSGLVDQSGLSENEIKRKLTEIFYDRISFILRYLKTGGLFYLGESFLLADFPVRSVSQLSSIFDRLGLEIMYVSDPYGYRCLLRKK
jgi:hypothetical protein